MSELQPPAPALESSRDRLRRSRRLGLLWIAVGLACFVEFVVGANLLESHASRLAKSGLHTPGTVLRVHSGNRFTEGSIDVAFRIDGVARTARIDLNSDSRSYSPGDSVDIIYNRANLNDVRTSREPNDPAWTTLVITLGLLGAASSWAVGWTLRRRARRWRKILASEPWRPIGASYAELRRGKTIQPLLRLTDGSTTVVRGTTSANYLGLDDLKSVSSVWACGPLAGRMIVTPTIGGRLFEVRPARRIRQHRRWLDKFFLEEEA